MAIYDTQTVQFLHAWLHPYILVHNLKALATACTQTPACTRNKKPRTPAFTTYVTKHILVNSYKANFKYNDGNICITVIGHKQAPLTARFKWGSVHSSIPLSKLEAFVHHYCWSLKTYTKAHMCTLSVVSVAEVFFYMVANSVKNAWKMAFPNKEP